MILIFDFFNLILFVIRIAFKNRSKWTYSHEEPKYVSFLYNARGSLIKGGDSDEQIRGCGGTGAVL